VAPGATWDVMSEQGVYEVAAQADAPLVVGTASLRVDVVRVDDGAPIDDATVSIDPTMPAHGHGGDLVEAEPLGEGAYAADLFLPMAGGWDLTVRVAGPEGTDDAVLSVEVR
jgi:hypothetical protein